MKTNKLSVKKLNILLAVGMLALYSLFCFILAPILRTVINDISLSGTVLPYVIEFLLDLTELSAIAFAYAVSVYIIFREGAEKSTVPMLIFCGATLFKHASNLLMSWVDVGFMIDSVKNDVWSVLIPLMLEILQYFIVIRLSLSLFRRYFSGPSRSGETSTEVYPFKRLLDLENPMLRIASRAAIVVIVTKVISRLVYDTVLMLVEGLPAIEEVIVMLVYYISDTIPGVICYLVMVLAYMWIFSREQTRTGK